MASNIIPYVPETKKMKYMVVTGGTVSGLGKGTAISSVGVVLQSLGLRVTAIKIDPYLNIDAGTMSPFEHGEVFVLGDGGEVDLDLGNYERFLNIELQSCHSITTGKIYDRVIKRERKGGYLGKTVQIVPHITDCIQEWITEVAIQPVDGLPGSPDVCLIELGGTVGDIESPMYLEALQQLQTRVGADNFCLVHLGMVPVMGVSAEQKTKPTQSSVKLLRMSGLKPDFLFCRCSDRIESATIDKLSLFGQVPKEHVISMHDVSNIYHVPLVLAEQNFDKLVLKRFGLPDLRTIPRSIGEPCPPNLNKLKRWELFTERVDSLKNKVVIGIVGKYTGLQDSYVSVIKALKHSCIEAGLLLNLEWIESEHLEKTYRTTDAVKYDSAWDRIKKVDGVLVPGGFGDRGIEGKILAARYCRENRVPYFGICIGLQTAVIEFARSQLGWEDANSAEFNDETTHPVVVFMPEVSTSTMGGTMRLGSRVTIIRDPESLAGKVYERTPVIYERHRHRYEVNPQLAKTLEAKGLIFTGTDERSQRMEIAEIQDHPFFLAVQYHPEFQSRPLSPSRPFLAFVLAAAGELEARMEADGGCLKVHGISDEDVAKASAKALEMAAEAELDQAATLGVEAVSSSS